METAQQFGVRFAEQVLGLTVTSEAPAADSPLGRVLAAREHLGRELTPSEFAAPARGESAPAIRDRR